MVEFPQSPLNFSIASFTSEPSIVNLIILGYYEFKIKTYHCNE